MIASLRPKRETSRTWSKKLVGREARFTKTIILQERASERLRGIRADFDWERRHALRRLRDRLSEAAR